MAIEYLVPGPCTISWDGNDLGETSRGVLIRPSTRWKPITSDSFGTEPVDFILAGKSAVVTVTLIDYTKFDKVLGQRSNIPPFELGEPAVGIGSVVFSGGDGEANDLGKILIITERDGSTVWTANEAVPSEPDQILLSATQELQLPITFVIVPDAAEKLFTTTGPLT